MGLFRRRKDPAADAARQDALTLQFLQRNGADLSQPRHVLHHLYFPTREVALAVARLAWNPRRPGPA